MSVQPQEKLKIQGEVIANVNKVLVGSRKRMSEIANTISLRVDGDAHELLKKSRLRLARIQAAFEAETKARGQRTKRSALSIIAGFATAYNGLDSAIDALEDGDLTKAELMEVASSTNNILASVHTLMKLDVLVLGAEQQDDADKFIAQVEKSTRSVAKVEDDEAPKKKTVAAKGGDDRMSYTPDKEIDEEEDKKSLKRQQHEVQHYDGIKTLFKTNQKFESHLPSSKTSKDTFVLLKLPVIPLMSKPVGDDQYEAAGFKIGGKAGFYTQLNEQVILGINSAKVKEAKMKLGRYVAEVVKVLSQKKHTIFQVIGSDGSDVEGAGRGVAQSHGFVYYWLMDEKKLSQLNRILGRNGGSFDVDDWGIAVAGGILNKAKAKKKK